MHPWQNTGVPSPTDHFQHQCTKSIWLNITPPLFERSNLKLALEKYIWEKQYKKDKNYNNLLESVKYRILNSSSTKGSAPALESTSEFKALLACKTVTKAQSELNHMLHLQGWEVDVPIPFMTSLLSGDWIVREWMEPSKMSLLFLGESLSKINTARELKSKLRLQFQQIYGKKLLD